MQAVEGQADGVQAVEVQETAPRERAKPSRGGVAKVVRVLGFLACVGGGLYLSHAEISPWPILLAVLPVYVALVVLHEAAHAIVGRLVGLEVFRVVVGSGRRWLRFGVGRTVVEARGLPISGITYMVPSRTGDLGWRYQVSVLAGPVVPAVAAVAVALAWPDGNLAVVVPLLVLAGVQLVGSLIPYRWSGLASDGHVLLMARRRDRSLLELVRDGHDALVLEEALDDGDAERVQAIADASTGVVAVVAASELRRWDQAIDEARRLLAGEVSDALRRTLANALAFALAHRNGPGDLDEADRITAGLMAEDPHVFGLADTRGLVLLRLGRSAEAIAPLEQSAGHPLLPDRTRTQIRARLAVARYGAGDPKAGRRDLARALAAAPDDPDVIAAVAAVADREGELVTAYWDQLDGDDAARGARFARVLGRSARATLAVLNHLAPERPDLSAIAAALGRARR